MNKIISTCLSIGYGIYFALCSSGSLAVIPGIDSLKKKVIESFLQTANNPKTSLHQKLVELNQIDGRNPHGIFPKTLTVKDIQVVTLDGEDQFGIYCSRLGGKNERFKCSQGVSETYLIMIGSKMSVHKAIQYQYFLFMIKSSKNMDWKIDENEKKYDYRESITIGEPLQVPTEKLMTDR